MQFSTRKMIVRSNVDNNSNWLVNVNENQFERIPRVELKMFLYLYS